MGLLRQCETEKLIINYCCWKMEGGELDEITSVELGARIHKGYSSGRWIGMASEYTRDLYVVENGRES